MAENIPSNKKNFYDSAGDGLSFERIEAYKRKEDVDELDAVARYLWNVALCESLYPCLECFEITLRNSIHSVMSRRYGSNWLQSARFLRRIEQDKVLDAEEALRNQSKPLESGRLVAELSLGFWTGLFVHNYDQNIAVPLMQSGFRKFPSALRSRRVLYDRFEEVRFLRNRVFHYEPIWYWQDLPLRHKALVDDIGFINPTTRSIVSLIDRFSVVHAEGWQSYRAKIENQIVPPVPVAPEKEVTT